MDETLPMRMFPNLYKIFFNICFQYCPTLKGTVLSWKNRTGRLRVRMVTDFVERTKRS